MSHTLSVAERGSMGKKTYEPGPVSKESRCARLYSTLDASVQERVTARVAELISENREFCDAGNYGHLCNMFSALAMYEALQEAGVPKDEAYDRVTQAMWDVVETTTAPTYRKLFSKPWVFGLLGKMLPKMFANGSGAGWEYVWHPESQSRDYLQFECVKCIYPGFFDKYGAPELGPAFCHADDINYGHIPGIEFRREHTLCVDGQTCDFLFVRKK